MKKRYGVEHISGDRHRLILFDQKETAERKAKELAIGLGDGEDVALVRVRCDDEGRLVSPTFEILEVWYPGKEPTSSK